MSANTIIVVPPYTFTLRLAQFVIAGVVVVFNIVSLALLGGYGALGYGVFTPFATFFIVGYWYISNYRQKNYYNRWAILGLDCWAVIWWLSLWPVLAEWAALLGLVDAIDNTYGELGQVTAVHALTAIAAVLGAAEFVLFLVTLVTFSIRLHRARVSERQGAHQNPFTDTNYQMNNGSNNTYPPQNTYQQKGAFTEVQPV